VRLGEGVHGVGTVWGLLEWAVGVGGRDCGQGGPLAEPQRVWVWSFWLWAMGKE